MRKLVIIPGGFHPYHAGHKALYDAARTAFPSAEVYVAATTDTSQRPFPFEIKEKLARVAGVPAHRFIQVKSPFRSEEITQHYDPENTQLIFVRSEKDKDKQPQPGGMRRDGTAAYLQPYKRNKMLPMKQHGYMAYLPVIQFGPGMTSATEIRAKWPEMELGEKQDLVNDIYPLTVGNNRLRDVVIGMLDNVMQPPVQETMLNAPVGGGAATLNPTSTPMPNSDDVDEAVLINDPEHGHQIRPDGGMGTWDEQSLRSNLARKFADMVDMIKGGNYNNLYHILYSAGTVQSMLKALQQYERFMNKQGRRSLARGRKVDLDNIDYVDERSI